MPIQETLESQFNLLDYLKVIHKRIWTVLAFFVIVVSLTVMSVSKQVPVYRATARIQIDRENPNILNIQEVMRSDEGYWGDEYFLTQVQILQSRSLALEVATKLGLDKVPDANVPVLPVVPRKSVGNKLRGLVGMAPVPPTTAPYELAGPDSKLEYARKVAVATILGMVQIDQVKNTRLIDISAISDRPKFTAEVANALAGTFIERNQRIRQTTNRTASNWLSEQLEDARKKVEVAENALQRYKEQNDIVASQKGGGDMTLQKLDELNNALTKAKTERIAIETRQHQVEKTSSSEEIIATLPEVMGNTMVQQLRREYLQAQRDLQEFSKVYTPKHPKIIHLEGQLAALQDSIKSEIAKVLKGMRSEYEVTLAREISLQEAVDQQKRAAQGLNQKYIQYGVLEREVENNRRIYDVLLGRAKEMGLVEGLQSGNIRVIDAAEVPQAPIGPNKSRSLLMAVMLGLVGGVVLAFFLEYLDDSIKDPDDLEQHIQLPFLAPIPLIKTKNRLTQRELIAHREPKSPYAEGYRNARTSIIYSSPDVQPTAILFTSSGPSEGKTTTAINMAVTMAHDGKRTLLVDADLRKPRVHNIFNLKNGCGLTNLLTDVREINAALQDSGIPNLTVITSGPTPPNPAELLGSKRMKKLLTLLKGQYDTIVFDCPPILSVADASILAHIVDGTVLVVRAGYTSRKFVIRARKRLDEVRAKVLGVVLNSVNVRKSRYYYSPFYYYAYYGEEKRMSGKRARDKHAKKAVESPTAS